MDPPDGSIIYTYTIGVSESRIGGTLFLDPPMALGMKGHCLACSLGLQGQRDSDEEDARAGRAEDGPCILRAGWLRLHERQ